MINNNLIVSRTSLYGSKYNLYHDYDLYHDLYPLFSSHNLNIFIASLIDLV